MKSKAHHDLAPTPPGLNPCAVVEPPAELCPLVEVPLIKYGTPPLNNNTVFYAGGNRRGTAQFFLVVFYSLFPRSPFLGVAQCDYRKCENAKMWSTATRGS